MWHASRAALAITHWVLYPLQKPCILPADMYTQLAHLDLGTGSLIIQVIVALAITCPVVFRRDLLGPVPGLLGERQPERPKTRTWILSRR